jgi:hypothetical protein
MSYICCYNFSLLENSASKESGCVFLNIFTNFPRLVQ